MIDGVKVPPLVPEVDARGRRMTLFGAADFPGAGAGGAEMETVFPGTVLPWRGHRTRAARLICIDGMAMAVLFDARDGSPTRGRTDEVFLGVWNAVSVDVPPGVLVALKSLATGEAILVRFLAGPGQARAAVAAESASGAGDADEIRRPLDAPEIAYDWQRREA
jgi:dTDP-4-dehydrorhamnose 3,5-epimerase